MAKQRSHRTQPHTYSLMHVTRLSLAILTLLFLILSLFSSVYAYGLLRDYTLSHTKETLHLYNQQVAQSLKVASSSMLRHTLENSDITALTYDTDYDELTFDSIRVSNLLEDILPGYTYITGIFVYTESNDTYVAQRKDSFDPMYSYIKKLMREGERHSFSKNTWTLCNIEEDYYLYQLNHISNCYSGSWFPLDNLTQDFNDFEQDALFIYADSTGIPLETEKYSQISLAPPSQKQNSQITEFEGVRYLSICEPLLFCDYYLYALVPLHSVLQPLRNAITIFSLVTALIGLLIIVYLLITSGYLSRPIQALQAASMQVTRNDISSRLNEEGESCTEVREIYHSINTLIEQITSLQSDVYEEKMMKTEFELQYLRSQVAPHFLINCFTTISSIPDTPEGHQLRKEMIRTLSDHLRYTLGKQHNVMLEDELFYVENYLHLTQLRFPGCLTYDIQADEDVMDASVFPLFILMETENSIKYNMIMGEPLLVRIICQLEKDEDGRRWLHMSHVDSGNGFQNDILDTLNNMLNMETNPTIDGHRIGLYNICKRVSLIYGDQVSIHFSNEPGMGARIDMKIPYIPVIEEDEL